MRSQYPDPTPLKFVSHSASRGFPSSGYHSTDISVQLEVQSANSRSTILQSKPLLKKQKIRLFDR
jgi:hypothetical protein